MALSQKGLVERVGSGPFAKKMYGKYWYPFVTRRLRDDDLVCLNWGYEEDPPMGLPLAPADEPNRFCIQLYHRPRPKWISVANSTGDQLRPRRRSLIPDARVAPSLLHAA
jgi:hypothetical protein